MVRKLRKPAVAGKFYPSSPAELHKIVDGYLERASAETLEPRNLVALIAPHAGYVFSGQVAAYSYKGLVGQKFKTVILVGPSHFVAFKGASIYAEGAFQTPLGEVEVDADLSADLIAKDPKIRFLPEAHSDEHSLEVQLPFLQRSLENFKVVPILIHDFSEDNCQMLSEALTSTLKAKNALLVASTDLSHYPDYSEARKSDSVAIEAIKSLNPDLIRIRIDEYMRKNAHVPNLYCMMCGTGAVISVLETAKSLGANRVDVIKYANSGDAPIGSKEQVVGYLSARVIIARDSGM